MVIAAIIGANFCLQVLRKNSANSMHQQLPSESSHSLFHASDSSSEHGGGGANSAGAHYSMEDGRASNPSSSKPSGLSTERVKGLLAKSASFLKDRVGRKTTPRGAGSKPAAGKDSKADKAGGYAAVRSPFIIGGDEEDEEEGFHDDGNGDDIRV